MKALLDNTQNLQGRSIAADLAERVAVVFEQHPMLCGFSVQERSTLTTDRAVAQLRGGLCLADVSATTPPGFDVTQEFCNQIAYSLLELIDEQPGVCDLLPGRTFARTLH
jgi:hypothetical protein